MSHATIILEDQDGAVAARLVFTGGFDRTSHAHQAAQILMAKMDEHYARQPGSEVVETTKPAAEAPQAPALLLPNG